MGNIRRYCEVHKLEKQSYTQEGYKNKTKWYCVECKRESGRRVGKLRTSSQKAYAVHLRRVYGLSWMAYQNILAEQGGRCAICQRPPEGQFHSRLVVDHDHNTNRVRGLLCHKCNVMLGKAEDVPEVLEAAAQYLRKQLVEPVLKTA